MGEFLAYMRRGERFRDGNILVDFMEHISPFHMCLHRSELIYAQVEEFLVYMRKGKLVRFDILMDFVNHISPMWCLDSSPFSYVRVLALDFKNGRFKLTSLMDFVELIFLYP